MKEKLKKDEWVSVEVGNEPTHECLLLTTSKRRVIGDFYKGIWWTESSKWVGQNPSVLTSSFEYKDITHWRELPNPPKI